MMAASASIVAIPMRCMTSRGVQTVVLAVLTLDVALGIAAQHELQLIHRRPAMVEAQVLQYVVLAHPVLVFVFPPHQPGHPPRDRLHALVCGPPTIHNQVLGLNRDQAGLLRHCRCIWKILLSQRPSYRRAWSAVT